MDMCSTCGHALHEQRTCGVSLGGPATGEHCACSSSEAHRQALTDDDLMAALERRGIRSQRDLVLYEARLAQSVDHDMLFPAFVLMLQRSGAALEVTRQELVLTDAEVRIEEPDPDRVIYRLVRRD